MKRRQAIVSLCRTLWISGLTLALAVGWLSMATAEPKKKKKKKPLPTFTAVRNVVDRHFAEMPDFRPGDIISQGDLKPIFPELKKIGWKVRDEKELVSRVADDQNFVVQLLRSKSGRKYMRKVSAYDLVYDRMDRTAQLRGGKRLLSDLLKLPDGHEYLQVKPTPGFRNLAQLLPKNISGRSPKGIDYDKPTGTIYTLDVFLEQLQQSHAAAMQRQSKKK